MEKYMLQKFILSLKPEVPFQLRYWDGTEERFGSGEPKFTLIFSGKVPIVQLIKKPSLTFGEAYMNGTIEIDGRIEDVLSLAIFNEKMLWSNSLSLLPKLPTLGKRKENVQHHYDIGNDFYSLWLDESMSYSCAYFKHPEDSLHQAQLQKIDHVLKKLQLKKGEKLLDIGSGWGWLIIRAAQQYGVQALGITISEEQFKKTEERIHSYGLDGQVQVQLMDYAQLLEKEWQFDKISSVGMFEHVGKGHYPFFMKTIQTVLKNKGVALLHTITHQKEEPVDPWIEKYIFPGGYIPSFREIIALLPDYDFHVLDVENLRLHYARTLDHWAERLEKQTLEIEKKYDRRFIRMWRLYLQSSAAFFRNGGLNIHQILFSKGVNNDLAMTREFLYQ